MANSDKNIRITTSKNKTTFPNIVFTGSSAGSSVITLEVLDDNTLSFTSNEGQVFSLDSNLSTGTIWSVNDISGYPLLRADVGAANGATIRIAEGTGFVGIGQTYPKYKLDVQGWAGFASTGDGTYTILVENGLTTGNNALSIRAANALRFYNSGNTFFTGFIGAQSGVNTTYTLPTTSPATGSSVLQSTSTGVMSWVPMTAGGSGTPGGSNKQIQYNNASAFGGASGFEYITAGIANTVSIFSASGTGYTSGLWIHAINGSTTRVGIGLSNPQFELEINGELSATNKSFVINHPTKSGMKLRYGSLEGPENGVYVRGELNNSNIIEVPDHWIGLVHEDSYTVHLTPIGKYAQLYVEKIENYNVYIADNYMNPIHCYYSVWAERKDIPKLVTEY